MKKYTVDLQQPFDVIANIVNDGGSVEFGLDTLSSYILSSLDDDMAHEILNMIIAFVYLEIPHCKQDIEHIIELVNSLYAEIFEIDKSVEPLFTESTFPFLQKCYGRYDDLLKNDKVKSLSAITVALTRLGYNCKIGGVFVS